MPVHVEIPVDDSADLLNTNLYAAGAVIRVERSAAGGGAGFAEIGTVPLVATTTLYDYFDSGGATGNYYRWRFSNTGSTRLSDYSDEVRAGGDLTYATVADLLERLPPTNATRDENLLLDLLVEASSVIDARTGRTFYREPQVTGTEVRYIDSRYGGDALDVAAGISSVTSIEWASEPDGTYAALATADWWLEPYTPGPGEPYFRIRLSPSGAHAGLYSGRRLYRVTGVFGFATVPPIIRAGTLALAREMYSLLPTERGSAAGGAGGYPVPEFLPRATYEAIEWGRGFRSPMLVI